MRYLLLLILGLLSASAHADRDIVYAARYYYPPGSHGTSHFHLYRINPDGTGRKQITFGSADDSDPQWSPDGRWILFSRSANSGGDVATYLIRSSGGRPIRLLPQAKRLAEGADFAWSPDSRMIAVSFSQALLLIDRKSHVLRQIPGVELLAWSPDGQRALVFVGDPSSTADGRAEILTWRTGRRVPISHVDGAAWWNLGQDAVWTGNNFLVDVARRQDNAPLMLAVCDLKGRGGRVVTCRWPRGKSDPGADAPDLGDAGLQAGPAGSGWNILAENNSISSWVDSLYSRVETKTGRLTYFAEGQLLVFFPDGHRFCLSPHREVVNYARRPDGTERMVWATPLQVGTPGGKLRTITPGLVWVTGADWRKR